MCVSSHDRIICSHKNLDSTHPVKHDHKKNQRSRNWPEKGVKMESRASTEISTMDRAHKARCLKLTSRSFTGGGGALTYGALVSVSRGLQDAGIQGRGKALICRQNDPCIALPSLRKYGEGSWVQCLGARAQEPGGPGSNPTEIKEHQQSWRGRRRGGRGKREGDKKRWGGSE